MSVGLVISGMLMFVGVVLAIIGAEDIALLRRLITSRSLEDGMRWLDAHRALVEQFNPQAQHAAEFLGINDPA